MPSLLYKQTTSMFKTPCIQRDRIGNTYKEAKKTAGLVSLFIVLKVLIARQVSALLSTRFIIGPSTWLASLLTSTYIARGGYLPSVYEFTRARRIGG